MNFAKCFNGRRLFTLVLRVKDCQNTSRSFRFFTQDGRKKHTVGNIFQPLTVTPKGAVVKRVDISIKSHKLMLDGGIIRQASPGMFHQLPLGMRVLQKLINLVDHEMQSIGCQRVDLSTLISRELWDKTGRWNELGDELFKLQDRSDRLFCLGPTHEESITDIMSSISSLSAKMLPIRLYQISKKFRDERRSRFGMLRGKEFIMKDLYSFDVSEDFAKITYDLVCCAYENLLKKLDLEFVKVIGTSGTMGGTISHEYQICAETGEDEIFVCSKCNYGANVEAHEPGSKESCPNCDSPLDKKTAIEVGHTFILGTKYSKPLKAKFRNANDVVEDLYMSCYGLGVSRLMAACVEVMSTNDEIRWPKRIAPYQICIIPPKAGSKEFGATEIANHLYGALSQADMFPNDVIFDDRTNLTIGQRMLEAKRTGYPYIVVTGKKVLEPMPLIELYDSHAQTTHHLTHYELFNFFRNTKLN